MIEEKKRLRSSERQRQRGGRGVRIRKGSISANHLPNFASIPTLLVLAAKLAAKRTDPKPRERRKNNFDKKN
jgi:hypothetical protein